jgi:hypothetical protein
VISTDFIIGNINVSLYTSLSSKISSSVSLISEIEKIKNGTYKQIILPCRKAFKENKEVYKSLKQKLPAITFCGVFKDAHKTENLIVYNNIVIIDIDNLSDEDLNELKYRIFNDRFVLSCWISPSGNGLKLLIRVNSSAALHKFTFDRIVDYFNAEYNIEIDICGSDVCRLCFISYDENLLLKNNCDVFPISEDDWLLPLITADGAAKKLNNGLSSVLHQKEKTLFYKTEGRNNRINRDTAQKILIYLRKSKQSITTSYNDWVKTALAISNSFTYDIGRNIFLEFCRLDGINHDEYKSDALLQYCYLKRKVDLVKFSSIIYLAEQKGFKYISSKKA